MIVSMVGVGVNDDVICGGVDNGNLGGVCARVTWFVREVCEASNLDWAGAMEVPQALVTTWKQTFELACGREGVIVPSQ